MCKVMITSGINDKNRARTIQFIKLMGERMSMANTDGLGYAAVDKEGNLFGERWLKNSNAFKKKEEAPAPVVDKALKYEAIITQSYVPAVVEDKFEYNSFGEPDLNKITAITLHTRYATSAKGMINTHPFHYPDHDTSLIHNGVISNEQEFKLAVSTCDSEAILQAYLQKQVNFDLTNMNAAADMLRGYYACGVFSRDQNGKRILDVFKGNNANLYVQEIKTLGIVVFATSDFDVDSVCKEMGLEKGKSHTVKEGVILRIDPNTDDVIGSAKFNVAWGYSQRGSQSHHYSSGSSNLNGTRGSNGVFDASLSGQRERQKENSLTEEHIEMMKLSPKIRELTRREVELYGQENDWWKTAKAE